MKSLNALAISISVLGALATYLALGPLGGVYLIWAAFVAWGAFYALGADVAALQKLVVCGIFGALVAWVVAVVILTVPLAGSLGLPLWAALVVGAGVVVVVLAANFPALATIPATVFGFASSFAYLLQTPDVLLSLSLKNSLVVISISLVAGGLFGLLSARWGAAMTKA
ncbi:MAG: DUF1097 domain-containing protein [Sulfuritalea sp.]|nr:DUF1097 domain-containing protein [Sulfuritalea sp.]MDP1985018.1 DUF1097 domain-containing protein [Sulfuritalea sp.]